MIGIDIGFGDVKAVTDDTRIKFPTAVAYAKKGIADIGEEEEYEFMGRKYLLGERALFSLDVFPTREVEFLLKYAPLLLYRSLKWLDSDSFTPVEQIAIGLPLAYHHRRFEFGNSVRRVMVNGEIMEFQRVEVFPQGVGILLDYRLNQEGEELEETRQNLLILDIGFNTVDVVVAERGRAVRDECGMLERSGVSRICQDLSNHLQRETTINLTEQEAKDVLLQRKLKVYGQEKELSETIRTLTENYMDWIFQNLKSRWGERLKRVDKLIIAGGGAYYVRDYLPEIYEAQTVIPELPEFANARGFLKGMKLKIRQEA
jgi:hypothetical protein